MKIKIDNKSRQPIYLQVVENLKNLIVLDILEVDEKLPSVRNLASENSITPNTVLKAYRELESQGFVYSVLGKGIFVSDLQDAKSNEKKENLEKELEKIMLEAKFIGMTKQQLHKMIDAVYEEEKS